jgi:hypothetical protein
MAKEIEPHTPKEEAPVEQVAHEEAPEEQEGLLSKNGAEEGAQQKGD